MTPTLLLALLVGCGSGGEDETGVLPPTPTDTGTPWSFSATAIGEPAWNVGGITLFSAPLDPATQECLFAANHTFGQGVWGPGVPHDPPYDVEIVEAVAGCGYDAKVRFSEGEFEDPNGIYVALAIQPAIGAFPGESPDFDNGPVIQDNRFPMLISGDLRRGGIIVDQDHDGSFPSAADYGFSVDGRSHVVWATGSNITRMPAGATPPGDYTWEVTFTDATGSAWDLTIPFTIEEDATTR